MPYYTKSEDWLQQSALLLQAFPATTIVTTKYHIKPARRIPKSEKKSTSAPTDTDTSTTTSPAKPAAMATAPTAAVKPPRGRLVLKTYCPQSGSTLKYKTSKAAEVTRLVQMLGTLGRRMAALPPAISSAGAAGEEDTAMADASGGGGGETSGVQTPATGAPGPGPAQQQQGQSQPGGGKGKKKKGKR
ncbi:signal recognition particle 9 kDa protein-domain-containing protein [Podospora didyma]|uniref:Signal recognition particle 9 kDa protein-domain-containing protein n=1 Tax=Podospora didyma TaxID=330526 RepID=A0AAE0KFH0_9PEZI|nr:signal recognition particle 9 kDa protein-domain-containing protein [Podospora didyma]